MTLATTLSTLIGVAPKPLVLTSVEELDATTASLEATAASGVERALLVGFSADRIGYAFAGGYRAALSRLVPGIARRSCLAATEEGGAHPRAIKTTLAKTDAGFVLDGKKTWVTLGTAAVELLVVASVASPHEADGKNRLAVVRLPVARAGVTLVARDPAPFAPEIPHSEALFEAVKVGPDEVLPGDGYDVYLKPFRTIEDLHVLAGLTGYLLSITRRFGPEAGLVEGLAALAVTLCGLESLDLGAPTTHVALAGAFATMRTLTTSPAFEATMAKADPDERARFDRDFPLFRVAERARAARLDAAWKKLATG